MISNFLLQKGMPLFLGLLGLSCIDTPTTSFGMCCSNFMDTLIVHFQAIFRALAV